MIVRLKDIALNISGGVIPDYSSDKFNIINQSCVRDEGLDYSFLKRFGNPVDSALVYENELLVNSRGKGTMGRVSIFKESQPMYYDGNVIKVKLDSQLCCPDFIHLSMVSSGAKSQLDSGIKDSTNQLCLTKEMVSLNKIFLPSYEDQVRIHASAEAKIKIINSQLVSLKQKLLHLDEYKTALTHNAVTKGLDAKGCRILDGTPAAEMTWKPSGVEWIGDVPDGWDVVKLKSLFNIIGGYAAPNDIDMKENDSGASFYRMAFMGKNSFTFSLPDSDEKLSDNQARSLGFSKIKSGSILIPKSGSVYKNHRCLVRNDCYIVSHIMALTPSSKLCSEYFTALLKMLDMAKDMTKTTGLDSIGQDDVKNFQICSPHMDEQTAISEYVLSALNSLNKTKQAINKKIDLLVEYKKSLINEAVTVGL